MDQYRVTQIIQELINDKNNELSQLNNYLSEAQTSSWNYVNPQDYQNMVNEKDMAWGRVSDLQNQLTSVQQNYDMFVSNSSNSTAELDAMRSVLEAVRGERDFFQSQLESKDSSIADLSNTVESKNAELASIQGSVNDLQIKITEQNTIVADLNSQLNTKQEEILSLKQKLGDFESKLLNLKSKIKAEMEEATSEVEDAFEESNLID
jgi:chromosome segregation ATPase